MTHTALPSVVEYPMAALGLTLILAVTRLVDLEASGRTGRGRRLRRAAAAAGLGCVGLIGSAVDAITATRTAAQPAIAPEPSTRA